MRKNLVPMLLLLAVATLATPVEATKCNHHIYLKNDDATETERVMVIERVRGKKGVKANAEFPGDGGSWKTIGENIVLERGKVVKSSNFTPVNGSSLGPLSVSVPCHSNYHHFEIRWHCADKTTLTNPTATVTKASRFGIASNKATKKSTTPNETMTYIAPACYKAWLDEGLLLDTSW